MDNNAPAAQAGAHRAELQAPSARPGDVAAGTPSPAPPPGRPPRPFARPGTFPAVSMLIASSMKKLEEMLAAMAMEQEAEEAGPSEPDIEAGKTLSPFLKFRV